MSDIVAKNFRVEDRGTSVHVLCDIESDAFPSTLNFEVLPQNADAVEVGEPNWALLSLLFPAMLLDRNIRIEADVSPHLLYNARNDLAHLIKNYHPASHMIEIEAGASSVPPTVSSKRETTTGFSGGVDSFATALKYLENDVPEGVRLTSVALYQVGGLGPENSMEMLNKARARIEPIIEEWGLGIYSLVSNMEELYSEVLRQNLLGVTRFAKSVSFRNAAAALVFQKEIAHYLASSNVAYRHATYGAAASSASLDAVLQPLMSTERTTFQCSVAGLSRREKLAFIADSPITQEHLDICTASVDLRYGKNNFRNCGWCEKCVLTMVSLEALGKLNNFSQSFDLEAYQANRAQIYLKYRNIVVQSDNPQRTADYALNSAAGLALPRLVSRTTLEFEQRRKRAGRKIKRLLGMPVPVPNTPCK